MKRFLTPAEAGELVADLNRASYRPCTCQFGLCRRKGHQPQPANCGHPGVYGSTPSGLTYCHREECFDLAGIASAMKSLAKKAQPAVTPVEVRSVARFEVPGLVPLVAGIPALPARSGVEAEVVLADGSRQRLSRLDGEARWTVDGAWPPRSSFPQFWNGRGSRCTALVRASSEVAAALDAAWEGSR